MPRHPRLRLADIPFHVIQRGNNRGACFFGDSDRLCYLAELKSQAIAHGVAIHCYVLMTNHVHLLMTPQAPDGIENVMKGLGQRYAQYVNRVHNRTGTLWEGRYRSCLVDADGYLLTCHRYIEENPVRAGMVPHPSEYAWSSYRANAHHASDPLVTPHPALGALGDSLDARAAAYRDLFRSALDPKLVDQIRSMTNGGFVLGSALFARRISSMLKRRVIPGGKGGRPKRLILKDETRETVV